MTMTPERPARATAVAPCSSAESSNNNMSIDEDDGSSPASSATVPSPPKRRIASMGQPSPATRLLFDQPENDKEDSSASKSFVLKPLDLNMELGEADEAVAYNKEDVASPQSADPDKKSGPSPEPDEESADRTSIKLFEDDDEEKDQTKKKATDGNRKISLSPPHSPDGSNAAAKARVNSYASPPSPEQTGYKSPRMSSSSYYTNSGSTTKSPAIRTMDGRTVQSKNPFSPWCDGDSTPSGRTENSKQQRVIAASTKPLSDSISFPVSFATQSTGNPAMASNSEESSSNTRATAAPLLLRKRTYDEEVKTNASSNMFTASSMEALSSTSSFNLKPSKSSATDSAANASLPSFSFSLRPKHSTSPSQTKVRRLSSSNENTSMGEGISVSAKTPLQVDTSSQNDSAASSNRISLQQNPDDISPTDVASFPFSSSPANTPTKTMPPPTPSKPSSHSKLYGSPPPSKTAGAEGSSSSEAYTPVRRPKQPLTPMVDRHGARSFDRQDEDNSDSDIQHSTKRQQSQSRFHSDFDVIGELGKGSFGIVYQVLSRLDGCMYAVKAAHRPAKGHADKDRMLKEVYALAALSDQADTATFHIVRYHQAWMEENRLYIQTELCTSTLSTELAQGRLATDKRRYKFAREMLLALEFLHRNGMVHLDIKPDNIFIKNDQFKLGDFGLVSKIAYHKDVEEGDSRYMSMELLSGDHDDLTKSDIFSLGITLYESFLPLGQKPPSNGPEWQDLRQAKIPKIQAPKEMLDIIQTMMLPEYRDRPTASELLKRPQLLSEDQRALQAERNKVLQANMALVAQERRLRLLASDPVAPSMPPPPGGPLVRASTWNGAGSQTRRRSL